MFQATINPDEARLLIAAGAQLVDVRTVQEYKRRALPGSVNIPLSVIQQGRKRLDRSSPVLLYCSSGQRSGVAKRLLEAWGFKRVHNLGSYIEFIDCDQP